MDAQAVRIKADAQRVDVVAHAYAFKLTAAAAAVKIVAAAQKNLNPHPRFTMVDVATMAEVLTSIKLIGTAADATTLVDAVSYIGVVQKAETVAMVEVLASIGIMERADAATLADATTDIRFLGTAADTLNVADVLASLGLFALADTMTLGEGLAMLGWMPRADSAAMADAWAARFTAFQADSAGMAETVAAFGQQARADTATMADAATFACLTGLLMHARPGEFWPGAVMPGSASMDTGGTAPPPPPPPAPAFVRKNTLTSTGSTGTTSFNVTHGAVDAGDIVVVLVANYADNIVGVTGSAGGAYTQAVKQADGGNNALHIFYRANHPGAANEVLTITSSNAVDNYLTVQSAEFANVLGASPLDKTGVSDAVTSTSTTVTALGANAQAAELVIAAFVAEAGSSSIGWSAPAGYTALGNQADSNLYTGAWWGYRVASSIETSSAAMTTTAAVFPDGSIATYKGA